MFRGRGSRNVFRETFMLRLAAVLGLFVSFAFAADRARATELDGFWMDSHGEVVLEVPELEDDEDTMGGGAATEPPANIPRTRVESINRTR